jgi:Protein of unknown function (DUF2934)
MDGDRAERLRERAYAIWEREGRPDGQAERHWAAAEAELGGEAPAAPDPADPDAPGRQPDPAGEGRQWWEKDATRHRDDREQANMAPDDLRSDEV